MAAGRRRGREFMASVRAENPDPGRPAQPVRRRAGRWLPGSTAWSVADCRLQVLCLSRGNVLADDPRCLRVPGPGQSLDEGIGRRGRSGPTTGWNGRT